jgi:uncharacterized membrane protein YphA (DoxX/SURF4 family)
METKIKIQATYFAAISTALFFPLFASAHENYVLTKSQINADLAFAGPKVFSALRDRGNLEVALAVGIGSLIAIVVYFLFQQSRAGQIFDQKIKKLEGLGHVVLRVALAASLIFSAYTNAYLGPEIPLASLPWAYIIKPALYILGLLMLFGLWSEVVGAASLVILLLATWVYKDYMLTYFNYLGEFIALLLYGSRTFSLDRLIYKLKQWAERHRDYELALIRITYGISIMYPAIIFKLLHPQVIVDIVNRYHLNQFHWLFPHDPLLIALGSGLAQVAVGICLIVGFETRINTFITFSLMTLSVIFFKESVWPHFILLALALYLLINNGGNFSLDYYLLKNKEKLKAKLLHRIA